MSRKRIPLNQNGCTANFRIGVPFEQNLHCNSCDALFYWNDGEQCSYLIEFKATAKKELLHYLNVDNRDKDQILEKVKGSRNLIINNLEFSGNLEHEELVQNLHCVIVYHGKNDVAASVRVGAFLPRRSNVEKDNKGHQRKASRQNKVDFPAKGAVGHLLQHSRWSNWRCVLLGN